MDKDEKNPGTSAQPVPVAPMLSREDIIESWGRDLAQNIPALRETDAHNALRAALDTLKQQLK